MSPFSDNNLASTKAMCLPALIHVSLPEDLQNDILQFKLEGFAKKYFRTQRKGLLRRKVPIEKMLLYQKDQINGPLLTLAPQLHKDAVKCFKILQKILTTKVDILECHVLVAELLEKGIRTGSLRDEIYVQCIKQLTKNPNPYYNLT
jgi:hypothetical protein